jgi:hypothetical protein
MCHLQTHPNSTWGSTFEGKGGPSPVNKKISQTNCLPVELQINLSKKFLEKSATLLDGGGRRAMVCDAQLMARQKLPVHLRPASTRSSLCWGNSGNPEKKVPPNPLPSIRTLGLLVLQFLIRGYSYQICSLTQICKGGSVY